MAASEEATMRGAGVPRGALVLVSLAALTVTARGISAMLPDYTAQFDRIGAGIAAWLGSIGIGAAQIESVAGIDPRNVLSAVSDALGGVFPLSVALIIVLTMMILMSADAAYVPTIMRPLNPRQPDLAEALGRYAGNVRRYLVATTVLGVAQGTLNALVLWVRGVPAALLRELLAFLAVPATLLGKAVLVHADEQARAWATAFGPDAVTRRMRRSADRQRMLPPRSAPTEHHSPPEEGDCVDDA
ncbi:AI-2E family transporter [Microbacterium caowuchunii]|uniref:AI-2E family transporter n=1 Tax=Microbacterium caowuchunii TaxID=2614638 RepID=UPI00177BFA41|nr:AI-2E family transporter [Microbacterium caowuchunii]